MLTTTGLCSMPGSWPKSTTHISAVAFCLVPQFLGATGRQYLFLLQGLKEVEKNLQALNIPFYLLLGDPGKEIPHLLSEIEVRPWSLTFPLCA